ncbi:bis(5'-nucleosyl)-tetraphosphatase (symmetrical) ApaH [Desulfosediminicola ganghwensis]|uniref:bis(5'-nucleosyl)-tetraphosphatase (symmetrical) ApaH n=1 Tax=Desulfosediminicola ganghwensis TaxID=2569540 RepID=UPI0010ACA1E2|nr:bis(5'-nucleosyl)-tetraphosphatase (symmetrical) ApaH [Desulfosediminicola ganghwensis]
MSTYIVGDVQGCLAELKLLLEKAAFNPQQDSIWFAGDLVAKGPESLKTLRFVHSLGDSATVVLGNHDLHLLAVSLDLVPPRPKDKTAPILTAPDKNQLLDWLRQQPLLAEHDEFVMCHAGISPQWDLPTARDNAREIENLLRSENWPWLIEQMYGNQPDSWDEELSGIERYRYIINAYTRMRLCFSDQRLDMRCKLSPGKINGNGLHPWFASPQRIALEKTVIFGHWASLEGCHDNDNNVIGLDTGCVWGRFLTMLRWEDQHYFRQPALSANPQ